MTEEKASIEIINMIKQHIEKHSILTWETLEKELDDMDVRIYKH